MFTLQLVNNIALKIKTHSRMLMNFKFPDNEEGMKTSYTSKLFAKCLRMSI